VKIIAKSVLPFLLVMVASSCGESDSVVADSSGDSVTTEVDDRPELECQEVSVSSPQYEDGADGAKDPVTAASPYVNDGQSTEVYDESSPMVTVFVMEDAEAVVEVKVQDLGNGWLISGATSCVS